MALKHRNYGSICSGILIRKAFQLSGSEVELIAVAKSTVVGGIVANWLSPGEIEIRHVAVKADYQGISVGRRLVEQFKKRVQQDKPLRITTYARNTSAGFFARLGFQPAGEYLEHPGFAAHGVSFCKMYADLAPLTNRKYPKNPAHHE